MALAALNLQSLFGINAALDGNTTGPGWGYLLSHKGQSIASPRWLTSVLRLFTSLVVLWFSILCCGTLYEYPLCTVYCCPSSTALSFRECPASSTACLMLSDSRLHCDTL